MNKSGVYFGQNLIRVRLPLQFDDSRSSPYCLLRNETDNFLICRASWSSYGGKEVVFRRDCVFSLSVGVPFYFLVLFSLMPRTNRESFAFLTTTYWASIRLSAAFFIIWIGRFLEKSWCPVSDILFGRRLWHCERFSVPRIFFFSLLTDSYRSFKV